MKQNIQLILFMIVIFTSGTVFSQDNGSKAADKKNNEMSIFLGAISSKDNNAFSIGLDYQYRINKIIGVGALAEYATGNFGSLLLGPSLNLHVWHFEFTIAPTVEFSGNDVAWPLRLGVAYEFELPKGVSISPAFYFDTERNDDIAVIYGVEFGFDF